ncbi:MAG: DNA binding protein [Trichoglossum hirsutum]|nr:MAG: DNA binding protein [Trichoglossum hirsutum]
MANILANSTRRALREGIYPPQTVAIGTSAKTSTLLDQALQQCQSLKIIQASVGFSIGCLAYLRDLIPEDLFDRATYGHPSSTLYSYDGLVKSTRDGGNAIGMPGGPSSTQGCHRAAGSGTRISILKRGHSEEVDQLLDWIEGGIFDALEKNVLAAIQFAIFLDKDNPEDIAESYTFSFKYQGDLGHGTRRLSGMGMAGPSGQSITLRSARDKLQGFLRSLCAITSLLPALPAERYLTIRLYYTDDCPPEYEPPGFKKCESNSMYFSESEDLKVAKESVEMKTGIHAVSLKVSAIDTLSRSEGDACTSKVMADSDIEITTGNSSVQGSPLRDELADLSRSHTQEDISPLDTPHPSDDREAPDAVMADILDAQNTKQARIDVEQKAELMKMLFSQSQSSNVETQEQGPSSQITQQCLHLHIGTAPPARQNLGPSEKREGVYDVDGGLSGYSDGAYQKTSLSKRKLTELMWSKGAKSSSLLLDPKGLVGSVGGTGLSTIRCECGTADREIAVLCCDFCGQSQHVHCYGYHSSHDPRIPNPHACYSCLLGGTEAQILEDLRRDCLFRRALKLVYENGYPTSEKKFSGLLGCSLQEARLITKRLKEEKFIDSMNHKKRSNQKGVPKFKVLKAAATVEAMKSRYFDPLARIAHHYNVLRSVNGLPQSVVRSVNVLQPIESSSPSSSTLQEAVNPRCSTPKSARRDLEDKDTTGYSFARAGATHKTLSRQSANVLPSVSQRKSPRLEMQSKKYLDLRADAVVSMDNPSKEMTTAMKRKLAESGADTSKRLKMSENNRLFSVSCDEVGEM